MPRFSELERAREDITRGWTLASVFLEAGHPGAARHVQGGTPHCSGPASPASVGVGLLPWPFALSRHLSPWSPKCDMQDRPRGELRGLKTLFWLNGNPVYYDFAFTPRTSLSISPDSPQPVFACHARRGIVRTSVTCWADTSGSSSREKTRASFGADGLLRTICTGLLLPGLMRFYIFVQTDIRFCSF